MTEPSSEFNPQPPSEGSHQQQVQHQMITARLPAHLGRGVFANATVVLSGQYELVIDFLICIGKPEQLSARVVLPVAVAERFVMALQESLHKYQQQFGPREPLAGWSGSSGPAAHPGTGTGPTTGTASGAAAMHPGGVNSSGFNPQSVNSGGPGAGKEPAAAGADQPVSPGIGELYGEIKMDESLIGGAYANVVLIRHTATEFCFDFVASIYPRSIVTARVYMPAPHAQPLLNSLINALQGPPHRSGS